MKLATRLQLCVQPCYWEASQRRPNFNLLILKGEKRGQERVRGLLGSGGPRGDGTAAVLWFQVEIVRGRSRNFDYEAAVSLGFSRSRGTKSMVLSVYKAAVKTFF